MRITLTSPHGQLTILVDTEGLNFLWDNKFTFYWNAVDGIVDDASVRIVWNHTWYSSIITDQLDLAELAFEEIHKHQNHCEDYPNNTSAVHQSDKHWRI